MDEKFSLDHVVGKILSE